MSTVTMKKEAQIIWDIAVIGGGPAGMMSAVHAGKKGKKVILIEKNPSLGVKLLITGGGRCNMTNAEYDIRKFLSKYKDSDKFLFSAFSQFSVKDTIDFFNKNGLDTKIEAGNRVFPITDKAKSVWDILIKGMREANVEILCNANVAEFEKKDNVITKVILKNNKEILAKKYIIAVGGVSRPETGSTGDGFKWLSKMGHTIIEPDNALVPIKIKDEWIKKLQGISIDNVKITTYQNNQKQESKKGRILFTHFGLSGPTILNMSKDIGELLKYDSVEIRLDLLPNLDHGMLNEKLQNLFKEDNKKMIKNSLDSIIPSGLIDIVLEKAGIESKIQNSNITRENRMSLINIIKNLTLTVDSLLGSDKAIISSGGVDLKEVDFKNMKSKLIENLYLVGDILNIDRPSGGYSLQLCWTTGYVAGNNT